MSLVSHTASADLDHARDFSTLAERLERDGVRVDEAKLGLGFDAVNSNTFQDQPAQPLSYKLGSFSNPSEAVRRQAIEHHRQVIDPAHERSEGGGLLVAG